MLLCPILTSSAFGQSAPSTPSYKSVTDLLDAHDRGLVRDLAAYVEKNPKADDLDRAYMALFETVMQHDWFLEHDALARNYLQRFPEGSVRPMARIVATMARAQDGKFEQASASFKELMKGLGKDDQEEFASDFADNLATKCIAAGEYRIAREVYETLLDKYGESPKLRAKVKDDLARIAMVGKPAPSLLVKDMDGKSIRISDYKGKYVLVDFWATWCAPCVAEIPNVQAAYTKYRDKGFDVLSVSLDETVGPLNDFLKTHKMPWRQIHNPTCQGDVVEAFGVNTIPASFLVGPDGTIVRLELRGAAPGAALAALIEMSARPSLPRDEDPTINQRSTYRFGRPRESSLSTSCLIRLKKSSSEAADAAASNSVGTASSK